MDLLMILDLYIWFFIYVYIYENLGKENIKRESWRLGKNKSRNVKRMGENIMERNSC